MVPLDLFFFFRIPLTIWDFLWFHKPLGIVCSVSVKNAIGILIGIALNVYIALGNMDILTILILPIHEHKIASSLLVPSSNFFISVL